MLVVLTMGLLLLPPAFPPFIGQSLVLPCFAIVFSGFEWSAPSDGQSIQLLYMHLTRFLVVINPSYRPYRLACSYQLARIKQGASEDAALTLQPFSKWGAVGGDKGERKT
jgi:hypothetical protein